MKAQALMKIIGADFYTGVPDSQLKALTDAVMAAYGTDAAHHVVAANEGNAAAIATGYYLATRKVPVIYLQNSGEGNLINPLASLMHGLVYAIPVVLIVGWRGEPGVHDEPQHAYQGQITLSLLESMGIRYQVISADTTEAEITAAMETFKPCLGVGQQVAFVIRKGALTNDQPVAFRGVGTLMREEVLSCLLRFTGDDPIVCTTGKASRELFELRERRGEGHGRDFLTVGSMGHSSSIALGIALQKPGQRVWCVDGDGAALMHLGAMAVIGTEKPANLVHLVINNGVHESVGGMPTAAATLELARIAAACGYPWVRTVDSLEALEAALTEAVAAHQLSLIEVKCAIGSRPELGRPTTTPIENRQAFMAHLNSRN